jgi:hypothetical protein
LENERMTPTTSALPLSASEAAVRLGLTLDAFRSRLRGTPAAARLTFRVGRFQVFKECDLEELAVLLRVRPATAQAT